MYNRAKESNYDVVFCNYALVTEIGKIISICKQPTEFIDVSLDGKKVRELVLENKLSIWVASYICKRRCYNMVVPRYRTAKKIF